MKTNDNQSTGDASGKPTDQSIQSLVERIQSSNSRIEQIVDDLKEIPGLSDALVDRANSKEFKLRNQISRVEHAIAILGMQRTVETIEVHGQHPAPPLPHFGMPNVSQPTTPAE